MVVDRILLEPVCPRGVLAFPLAGKFKNMRERCVLLTAARAAAHFERDSLWRVVWLHCLSQAGMVYLGSSPSLGPSEFSIEGR